MKKVLATILALVMALGLTTAAWADGCSGGESCTHQAAIGSTHYDTLIAAVADVADGGEVTLLRDVPNGVGIGTYANPSEGQIQSKSFTINFNGKTYTLKSEPVGSANTETQGFHLEWAGASNAIPNIVFKNGKIDVAEDRDANMMMAIQNYCNLTLKDMVIDGRNLVNGWGTYTYVTSNNCGNTIIENTMITANEGSYAFDVDGDRRGYTAASVTIRGSSTLTGDISFARGDNSKNSLEVTGGNFTADVSAYAPEGTPVAIVGNEGYAVGSSAISAAANGGKDVTVVKAGPINGVDAGKSILVARDVTGTVTINGNTVTAGTSYTVPARYYYYNSTTTDTKGSPKTFDAGIALYVGMALTSAAGVAFVGKKRED